MATIIKNYEGYNRGSNFDPRCRIEMTWPEYQAEVERKRKIEGIAIIGLGVFMFAILTLFKLVAVFGGA